MPQLGQRWSGLATVEGTECTEQVVDLILQRQLREQAYGVGIFEPLLQARQIERRRCRRLGDRLGSRWLRSYRCSVLFGRPALFGR